MTLLHFSKVFSGTPVVSDVTAPTVTSAAINTAGTSLTLNFSETVVIGAGGDGGLTITPSGSAATLTYASGSGSTALVYTISRTILQSETVTRTYVQPGNGIEDSSPAGNDLASFTTQAVTNNSTQTGAFTPLVHINFDGLTDTQAVYGSGSTAGKRWDAVANNTPYAGGYGMRATTSQARSGKTSSCAISIQAGSDGDPSGGGSGVGMGAFGGYVGLDNIGAQVTQGQELWCGAWYFFPTGWSWGRGDSGDQVKFQRWQHTDASDHMDIYILNGNATFYNSESESQSGTQAAGYAFRNEYDTKPNADTDFTAQLVIPLNQWVWIEQYFFAHSSGASSIRRLWVNDTFVREQNGTAAKWRGNDTTIHTKTVTGGVKTLQTSGDAINSLAMFTYWNGNAPQNQTCYIANIVMHKNGADLSATDEFGNKMMGSGAV